MTILLPYQPMNKPIQATSVQDYINQIDAPRKQDIQALHALISKTLPTLPVSLQSNMIGYGTYHYRYATGREGDAPIIALASQKNYISIYAHAVTKEGKYVAEAYADRLGNVNVGKSCIRFKHFRDINTDVLMELLKETATFLG